MSYKIKNLVLMIPGFVALCRFLTRHHVRVLMFHRFTGLDELGRANMSAETIARQATYIGRHHRSITPEEHIDAIRSGKRLGGCPAVLTIDDGYHDFYEIAYPRLRENGVQATVFAATGLVSGTHWFWWDKLAYIVEEAPIERAVRVVAGEEIEFDVTSVQGRNAVWSRLSNIMRFLPNEQKDSEILHLAESFGLELPDVAPPAYSGFTWDEAREMQEHGITLSPHTVTHPILSRVPVEQARWEIEESKRQIEEATGRRSRVFCYPQGGPLDFSPVHRELVGSAGMEASYVAYQDIELSENLYLLPRYNSPNRWVQFIWIMCGAEYLILRIKGVFGHKFRPPDSYWEGHDPDSG